MRKRLFAVLMAVLLILFTAVPAFGADLAADIAISTEKEFLRFAENCRLDSYSRGMVVVLRADLDLTGMTFDGIPIFCGTFDGQGHTIAGLSLSAEGSAQGLFRYLTAGAVVRGLTVRGDVMPHGSRSEVGGIVGSNEGLVTDCRFSGTVSGSSAVGGIVGSNGVTGVVEECHVAGEIRGIHYVGGIAGVNYGVVRGCVNGAEINATAEQNSVDFSDITLETITGTESSASVTDIGGIAGANMGVIRSCDNRETVGYPHMGYNVGGIAGSHTGYITECSNYGRISGRKEVGGIVGQMEPVAKVEYSEDTLQTLNGQIGTMAHLANNAVGSAESGASAIGNQVGILKKQTNTARDALDQLIPDLEDILDPAPPDWDRLIAAQNTLSYTVTAMPGTVRNIITATGNAASDVSRDVLAVINQMNVIGQVIWNGESELGGSINDVSDQDSGTDFSGKVEHCANYGGVLADLNAGGIAGGMAFENELDHEDDLQVVGSSSLNFEAELRVVIRDCSNSASVTVRRQNAGGVVGWQFMGLVRDCMNSGSLEAPIAEYVGGIAGRSGGYIRNCSSKCVISGGTSVGGIAGVGAVVTHCRAMTVISGGEKLGGLLGAAAASRTEEEKPIEGNVYLPLSGDPGAIDGISYAGIAEPMATEEFLKLEHLPEMFRQVTVRFLADGETVREIVLEPGGILDRAEIPEVPVKEGYIGSWEGIDDADLSNILFDRSFAAAYTGKRTVIESSAGRESSRALLMLEGVFEPDSAVELSASDEKPPMEEKEIHLESWSVNFEHCTEVTGGRLLLPGEHDGTRLRLFLREEGRWREETFLVRGSYIVFEMNGQETELALVEVPFPLWQLAAAAGAGLLVIVVIIIVSVCSRRRKKLAAAVGAVKE